MYLMEGKNGAILDISVYFKFGKLSAIKIGCFSYVNKMLLKNVIRHVVI